MLLERQKTQVSNFLGILYTFPNSNQYYNTSPTLIRSLRVWILDALYVLTFYVQVPHHIEFINVLVECSLKATSMVARFPRLHKNAYLTNSLLEVQIVNKVGGRVSQNRKAHIWVILACLSVIVLQLLDAWIKKTSQSRWRSWRIEVISTYK